MTELVRHHHHHQEEISSFSLRTSFSPFVTSNNTHLPHPPTPSSPSLRRSRSRLCTGSRPCSNSVHRIIPETYFNATCLEEKMKSLILLYPASQKWVFIRALVRALKNSYIHEVLENGFSCDYWCFTREWWGLAQCVCVQAQKRDLFTPFHHSCPSHTDCLFKTPHLRSRLICMYSGQRFWDSRRPVRRTSHHLGVKTHRTWGKYGQNRAVCTSAAPIFYSTLRRSGGPDGLHLCQSVSRSVRQSDQTPASRSLNQTHELPCSSPARWDTPASNCVPAARRIASDSKSELEDWTRHRSGDRDMSRPEGRFKILASVTFCNLGFLIYLISWWTTYKLLIFWMKNKAQRTINDETWSWGWH